MRGAVTECGCCRRGHLETIRPRTVRQRRVEELKEMLGQRAGAIHEVKDQGGQELSQRHARFATRPDGQQRRIPATDQLLPDGEESGLRLWRGLGLRFGDASSHDALEWRTLFHPKYKWLIINKEPDKNRFFAVFGGADG